tara:strand:+ start:1050 stop:1565 length:516 start_codon:yes stop_codon:yes gene_type:complete
MKLINYLIILTLFLLSITFAKEKPPFKNILSHNEPKVYKEIIFEDRDGGKIDLKKINSDQIYILNFWATWCAPCKEEMPSLDKLHAKDGIFVFPINLEDKNLKKTNKFFKDLNIINLNTYFDENLKLVKAFSIRGVPTTIIFNKNKDEIARITGGINFSDEKFIYWLESFK